MPIPESENKKGTKNHEKGASQGEQGARATGGAWRSLDTAGRDRQLQTNAVSCGQFRGSDARDIERDQQAAPV